MIVMLEETNLIITYNIQKYVIDGIGLLSKDKPNICLIEFKNKPDTSTPINADNLNFNFNELNTLINNIYNRMWPRRQRLY